MADSLITEDVKRRLGKELVKPATLRIEKGAITRFCRAVGDPNPLWQDDEYARVSRFGGITAPPGFISQLLLWDGEIQKAVANIEVAAPHMLAGGTEFEFFQPVRTGDTITGTAMLVDAYEREGKSQRVLFLVSDAEYTNQDGVMVLKETNTVIRY